MTESNPHFKHPERSTYELNYLLRALPQHFNGETLSEQQLLEIAAADLHALNSAGTLLSGLQSLGRVAWSASVNEAFPPDTDDLGRVGLLVTEVALQLQFLFEFRQSVEQHELRIAHGQAKKRGGQAR